MSLAQTLAPLAMIFAAAVAATDRRLIRQLRDAAAISPADAQTLRVRRPLGSWRLRRLVGADAIRIAAPSLYYLDEAGLRSFRSARRRRAGVVLGTLLLALLLASLAGVIEF